MAGFATDKNLCGSNNRPKSLNAACLMTTDPGDLVLDPTCGCGTTAYVAEQWGRRWITIDTSRVALALARTRLMAAKYPYYLLADSAEGIAEGSGGHRHVPPRVTTRPKDDVSKGFVYKRVPHVTLKSIANNEEIDAIHAQYRSSSTHCGRAEQAARSKLAGMGSAARSGPRLDAAGANGARGVVVTPARAPEGDRRLHRPPRRHRIPLRSALRRHQAHPRDRAVHRRKPLAAPRPVDGRGTAAVRGVPASGRTAPGSSST